MYTHKSSKRLNIRQHNKRDYILIASVAPIEAQLGSEENIYIGPSLLMNQLREIKRSNIALLAQSLSPTAP